jgi:hypothetical protein
MKKGKKNSKKYVRNEDILKELKILKETGNITDKFGKIISKIANGYVNTGYFVDYTWKEDMVSDAVLTCLLYVKNFDVDVDNPNPFAYITTICKRAFLNYIKKQKKHSKIKDICYNNSEFLELEQYIKKGINYEQMMWKGDGSET